MYDMGVLRLCHTDDILRRPWELTAVVMSCEGVNKSSV